MAKIMSIFIWIIIIQLFYAFSITLITHAMPDSNLNHVEVFNEPAENFDMIGIKDDVESSLQGQTTMPVVDIGALVFYSGNILLDLLLNFFFAIPQMLFLLITAFTQLFNMPEFITAQIEIFVSVIVAILYFISLMQLLLGVRSGRSIA